MRDGFYSRLFVISAFCSKNAAFYLKGDYGLENSLALHAMAKRLVILSAKRERIRNTLKRVTDCRAPFGARNDVEGGQMDCCTSNGVCSDKKLVILSAKHERIRNALNRVTDCHSRFCAASQ